MAIAIKSNIDGSGEILKDGVNILTLGTDDSVKGAFVDTDGFMLSGMPGYNYIINGNFDIWQRGTSQTISGYGSDDRWLNNNLNTTKVHSRQAFAVGQTFPDGAVCPNYYSRTVVSSVVGADNNAMKQYKIESVKTLSGKKAMLSFYAKADAPKNVSIECLQNFGGGSEHVLGISVQKIALSSTWTRFVIPLTIPSIYGKTIGVTSPDCLALQFWFDAGSNLNARTASLGHQSGTFDIACVSLVEGDKDIKPIPRSYGEELALCQRYYEVFPNLNYLFYGGPSMNETVTLPLKVVKRATPLATKSSEATVRTSVATIIASTYLVHITTTTDSSAAANRSIQLTIALDAEL